VKKIRRMTNQEAGKSKDRPENLMGNISGNRKSQGQRATGHGAGNCMGNLSRGPRNLRSE
jgi:hypothetical protein